MEKFSMLFHKLKREFTCPSGTAPESPCWFAMSFASVLNDVIMVILDLSLFSLLFGFGYLGSALDPSRAPYALKHSNMGCNYSNEM